MIRLANSLVRKVASSTSDPIRTDIRNYLDIVEHFPVLSKALGIRSIRRRRQMLQIQVLFYAAQGPWPVRLRIPKVLENDTS